MKTVSPAVRWVVLAIASIVIAANYYVYDAMSSIKSILQAQLGFTNVEYGLIVSFYSFPNTFLLMSILGGIILDKWGIRRTGFLFVAICTAGAFLTAYGASDTFRAGGFGYGVMSAVFPAYSAPLKMMMLGRLLFGLGAETSIVVINKVLVKWFKGRELATAFAVNIAIARVGTAAALIFSPQLVGGPMGWTLALWVAAVIMGVGFLFWLVYLMYDATAGKGGPIEARGEPSEEFRFADIVALVRNKSFLYVIFLCVTFYSAVFPFQAYCPDLLHNKFGLDLEWSGMLSSLIIWGTIVFTPLFGWFVDRRGKRATLMILGSGLLIATHLVLALTSMTPYVAMFILGIAFSLVPAAMWPAVALIVEEKRLGTAYGAMASLQNLGLWAFPILAGWILDVTNPGVGEALAEGKAATYDYTWTILLFAALGLLGFLFSWLLKREDATADGHGLEKATTAAAL
ncbi:MAG: MFS transporter [Bacteroidota bacterium]|nr:MFS transporter [Bacteroidota bacterium]